MGAKKLFVSFFLISGLFINIFGAEINIYIKNNADATNISDIIILGRKNGGNGEWTNLWGGQKSSRSAKDKPFGYREIRKFVFKNIGMSYYQIRYTVKRGELNLVENYWEGPLEDRNIFIMESINGVCSLSKTSVLAPQTGLLNP